MVPHFRSGGVTIALNSSTISVRRRYHRSEWFRIFGQEALPSLSVVPHFWSGGVTIALNGSAFSVRRRYHRSEWFRIFGQEALPSL